MGDSDRMRNYISDYLENSLDPSMHKEFEDALKKSPKLRSMTDNLTTLSTHLSSLKYHNCSDNFSVKLRERIHTSSEPLISRQTMIRYSFAASFVIILVIATFAITNLLSDSSDITPPLQGSAGSPANTTNPAKSPVLGNKEDAIVKESEELDIGTKSSRTAAGDSVKSQYDKKNRPAINQVDQKNEKR